LTRSIHFQLPMLFFLILLVFLVAGDVRAEDCSGCGRDSYGHGYYCDPVTITCLKCPFGFYCSGSEQNARRDKCDSSKPYTSKRGATSYSQCVSYCPSGYENDPPSNCKACAKGRYGSYGVCDPCQSGKYAPFDGLIKCYYCATNTYSSEGASACTNCNTPGFYTADHKSCIPVKASYYSTGNGPQSCQQGRYSDTTGLTSCTLCPKGTYQNGNGQTACRPCTDMNSRYYSNNVGSTTCQQCSRYSNYYLVTSGSMNIDCISAGSDESVPWSYYCGSSCNACTSGKYTAQKRAQCTLCPAGSYCTSPTGYRTDESSNPYVIPCPVGTYSDSAGLSSLSQCKSCPVGEFSDKTGQSSCDDCAKGTYTTAAGSSSCEKCPAGTFGSSASSSVCSSCEKGKYNDKVGQGSCTPCGLGKYTDVVKSSSCTDCAAGKYQDVEGEDGCLQCTFPHSLFLLLSSHHDIT
jgi:hypothetical protein